MIAVDANVIIYLVYETTFTALAREVYTRDPVWVVPELWEAEVLNGLLTEVRAGHLEVSQAQRAASMAADLLSGRTPQCDRASVLHLADDSGLTAYDAYYVAVARTLGVPLVTEDATIRRRCPDVARSMRSFLGRAEGPTSLRESRAGYRVRRKSGRIRRPDA